ncbi:MAG: PAS domain S-box protein [Pseudomonadota bacterium]
MAIAIIHELASNAAILLLLSFLYVQVLRRWGRKKLVGQVLNGVLFGVVAVGVMLTPLHLMPGVVFDTRSVVISVGGLFGGPLVAAITFSMASVYRIWMGGAGTLMGVLVSFSSAALGSIFYFWGKRNAKVMQPAYLYAFGVIVHLVMLVCALALPGETTWRVLQDISLPVILVYPLATLLISILISDMQSQIASERRVKESEEKYRRIVDTANEGVLVIDHAQTITFANRKMAEMTGYLLEELRGRSLTEFYFPEDLHAHEGQMERRRQGLASNYERRVKRKDGSERWFLVSAVPMFEEGDFIGSLAMYSDITDRKQAEAALRGKAAALQEQAELLDLAHDSIIVRDLESRVIFWNRGAEESYGWSRAEAQSKVTHDLLQTEFPQPLPDIEDALLREGRWEGELTHTRRDGSIIIVASRWVLSRDEEGRPRAILEINNDITQRKRANDALRANEKRLQAILEASADPLVVYDAQGNTTFVNPAFTRVFGWLAEEVLGRQIPFVPDDQKTRAQEIIRQLYEHGGTTTLQTKRLTKSGESRDIVISAAGIPGATGGIAGMVVNLTDVTHTKKLEAQLRQSQKMEAIGTLAGGIAHDFNNILGAIMGYSELALEMARNGRANIEELNQVLQATDRARRLVKQILTFSRKVEADLKPLSLNTSVRQTLNLLGPTLPKMISIETILAADLKTVMADPNQMEQVLLNLASNAADAMPEGGRLVIETRNEKLDREYCSQHLEMNPGDYVLLMVSDTGQGIDPQTLEHIFDLFFTTKAVGKGTGLGLATVYGIVKSHRGEILCYSEPGMGTSFKIYLPAFQSDASKASDEEPFGNSSLRGSETILLVDDEPALRELGQLTLEGLGYRVLTADCGETALELFKDGHDQIDLVVMDLGMPGMGGHRCLREMLVINPKAKVVIASGYSANGQVRASLESGAAGYVAKPYRRVDLLTTVRDVLDK